MEGSSKSNTAVIVLSITTAVFVLTTLYTGYEMYSMNKEIRELHDNINKLPAGSLPANLIPQDLMIRLNKMKAA